MANDDSLKLLCAEEIPKLLEVLHHYLPQSSVVYNWIKTQSRWQTKIPEMKLHIFCPGGDWAGGAVIAYTSGIIENKITGVVYCVTNKEAEFKEALINSKQIPWDRLLFLNGVVDKNVSTIQEVLNHKQIKFLELATCYLQFMDAQVAKQCSIPNIPKGVCVKELELSDADVVCDNWPHYQPIYRPQIECVIKHNLTVGVFVKEGDKDVLAAMAVQPDYGGIGMLQTVPRFRRLGYASLALGCITRKMGEADISPHFHVIKNNQNALKLFQKTDFKTVCESNWVCLID